MERNTSLHIFQFFPFFSPFLVEIRIFLFYNTFHFSDCIFTRGAHERKGEREIERELSLAVYTLSSLAK